MALTDAWLRAAKGQDKPYKKGDSGRLYILVKPDGGRFWRLDYKCQGKSKTLALGTYPQVSLAEAREARDAAKKLLKDGIDPGRARKEKRVAEQVASQNSFERVAREWLEWRKESIDVDYAAEIMTRLEQNIFPTIGHIQIDQIEPPVILAMLRKIEERGALTMAKKVKGHCSQIFRYGIASAPQRCTRDPTADLRGALKPSPKPKRHRAVSLEELPELLRRIDRYAQDHDGHKVTQIALQLITLTMLRTSELRLAEWRELEGLDTKAPLWRIPDERMKMDGRDGHLVPLSRQAVALFHELREFTGKGRLMFPSVDKPGECMSNNTMLFALYRMGYHSKQTTHGFRRIASTVLNENGFNPDAIERQLAHEEEDETRAAYNAAAYLAERRAFLQWYADYLDALKTGQPIPPARRRRPGLRLVGSRAS
jgi:integrase